MGIGNKKNNYNVNSKLSESIKSMRKKGTDKSKHKISNLSMGDIKVNETGGIENKIFELLAIELFGILFSRPVTSISCCKVKPYYFKVYFFYNIALFICIFTILVNN